MRNLLLSGIALGVLAAPVMAADLAPSFKAPIPVTTGPAHTSADTPAARSAEKMRPTRQSERR
jgi:hypothetical protein